MTIVDLRQNIFFPPGAFVSVRIGLMLRMSPVESFDGSRART
jgi:hypothetical protein